MVVLDFDGDVGRQSLNELGFACPEILQTRTHHTGGGGTHLFFRHPGFAVSNSTHTLRPGMDVRGDNGLIILPPSVHASRRIYSIANVLPIAQPPASLIEMLQGCHKERLREIRSNDETSRVTKQVERERESNSEILKAIPQDRIAAAIEASLPTRHGRRNQQIFQLARHLQAIDGITRDSPVIEFRQVVEQWLEKAYQQADRLGFTIDGDLEETWTDFQFAWGRVRYPEGCVLKPFFDRVAEMDSQGEVEPVVWNSLVYFRRERDRAMRLICSVAYELSKAAGSEPFSLACNAAAEHFKRLGCATVDSKWVLRRLQTLSNDGILICIDRGRQGRKGTGVAAKYRWIWTLRDPPPVQQY